MIMGPLEIVQNYVLLPRSAQKMAFHKGFQLELRQELDHLLLATEKKIKNE